MVTYKSRKSSSNKIYRIYQQERDDSCGPACLRTVVYLFKRQEVSEQTLRDASGGSVRMVAPGVAATIAKLGKQTLDQGTTREELAKALLKLGLRAKPGSKSVVGLASFINTMKPGTVYVVKVGWTLGGAHWVVIPEARNNNVVVLDPADAMLREGPFSSYLTGAFDGEYLEVSS